MTETDRRSAFFVGHGFGVDFLMSLLFFFGISSLGIFLVCYVHFIRVYYWVQFTAIAVVLAFVFIRRMRIGLFPMLFLHLLVTGIYCVIIYYTLRSVSSPDGGAFYLALLLLANIIYSLKQRVTRSTTRVRNDGFIFLLIIHVILFIIFIVSGYHFRLSMITTNAILIVTCFFVARQFDTFESKYYHNIHSATQPVSSIKKQNRFIVLLVVGGILFSVIMLLVAPTDEISKFLSSILLAFVRWIAGFFPSETVKPSAADMLDQKTPSTEEEFSKTSFVNILAAISVIIIAILLFVTVVTLIIEIVKRFRNIEPVKKTVENDAVTDVIESLGSGKEKKRSFRHDFGEGYEKEIRKKYYQKVSHAIKKGLPIKASSSPHQIEKIIKRSGDPSITELTSQYESVRYNKKQN